MSIERFKWLLDTDLPRLEKSEIDAIHGSEMPHVPGVLGLTASRSLGRALVTCNRDFLGPWEVPIGHPGIVVIDQSPTDGIAVERILQELEFRLGQFSDPYPLDDNRFFVDARLSILQVYADGEEHDIEPWKQVRLTTIGALSI
jgi:hypothetical protein